MYSYLFGRKTSRAIAAVLLCLLVLALSACEWTDLVDNDDDDDNGDGSDNTPPATETNVPGLSVAVSSSDFETTLAAITNRTSNNRIATVDHQASASQSLRPTTVVLFDAPNRSSPLIAADPRAGLDLPARVLVYRDSNGDIAAAYTNAAYLAARYDLDAAEDGALDGFDADLETIVTDATGDDPSGGAASGIGNGEGIESVVSGNEFADTVDALLAAINDRAGSPTSVDQQTRASSVGRTLNPSTLVMFTAADPDAGLLRASQTSGVDLPQKMLVSEADDGTVTIYYNDPAFIADRHDIDNRDDETEAIAGLLCELAAEAAGDGTADCNASDFTTPDTDDGDTVDPSAPEGPTSPEDAGAENGAEASDDVTDENDATGSQTNDSTPTF